MYKCVGGIYDYYSDQRWFSRSSTINGTQSEKKKMLKADYVFELGRVFPLIDRNVLHKLYTVANKAVKINKQPKEKLTLNTLFINFIFKKLQR